jgi:hypothetical protein
MITSQEKFEWVFGEGHVDVGLRQMFPEKSERLQFETV